MLSSNDSFISMLRRDKDRSLEQLNAALCTSLLSTLPSMLSALEESRLRHHCRNKRSKDGTCVGGAVDRGAVHDVLEGCFGNGLDRYGLKILVLLLLKLLEMKINTLSEESVIALANRIALTNGAKGIALGRESALDVIYHAIERHLIAQHDVTVTSVGVRVLSEVIGSIAHGKVGSLAWRSFRSVYTESVDVGLHLSAALPGRDAQEAEEPPGMDGMWTQLVDLVSRQTMCERAVLELTHLCNKNTLGAVGLMHTSFSTHSEMRSMRPTSDRSHDLRDSMAYRQLWLCWWAAESSDQRVYGVALLLQEVLQCLCSSNRRRFNAPVRKVHADGRVRSMKAAEYMLNHSPSSTVTVWTNGQFPFLSHGTVEFHLQLSLSLLPALLILSSPPSSPVAPLHKDRDTPFNPYRNLIHVSMLTVWTFDAFTDITVEQQELLGLVVNLSHQVFRVVRCILNGSPLAAMRMIEWRSRQPLLDEDSGGSSADINDPGSMHYLQHALRWTVSAVKHVASFVDAFRRVMVQSGQFDAPRSLLKTLPGIQSLIERTLDHLIQLCHVNSVDLDPHHDPMGTQMSFVPGTSDPTRANTKKRNFLDPALQIGRVGDKEMQTRMQQFLEMHDKRLSEPVFIAGRSAFESALDEPRDPLGGDMELCDEESDLEFGFVPAVGGALSMSTPHESSSVSGWGLYDAAVGNVDEHVDREDDQWSNSMSDEDKGYESAGSDCKGDYV